MHAKPVHELADRYGRKFEYLRLSLTDVCNFRCSYCLPDGYLKTGCAPDQLSVAEVRRLVSAFAELGLWKVRLTGGEPTLRREMLEIARTISHVPGIRTLAMTTNGYRLRERAADYAASGITSLNVSVDSLDPARFAAITGHNRLPEILAGIEAARNAGIRTIKLNSVLIGGVNDDELDAFIGFAADHDLTVRYIEIMRTNENVAFFAEHHRSGQALIARLEDKGWQRAPRRPGDGPAIEFVAPMERGRIGVIAPYARDFCASCNRLRVSASGKLHLCLFGDAAIDLRPLLRDDSQQASLVGAIKSAVFGKVAAHRLHEGNSGATPHLASIGG